MCVCVVVWFMRLRLDICICVFVCFGVRVRECVISDVYDIVWMGDCG